MPDALAFAQYRGFKCYLPLALFTFLLLGSNFSFALDGLKNFDIPSQPLANALVEFADRTGMAALIDAELAKGLQSSAIKGRLLPADALRVLLAGTGLSIRYAGATAFTVGPKVSEQESGAAQSQKQRPADYDAYFSHVQGMIERILCQNDETRPGQYRTAFQIWIGDAGTIQALHPLGTSGDEHRDESIAKFMANASVAPPPPGLPQPVTIVLQPRTYTLTCADMLHSRQ
ncbi:STN domain-containing protein [Bradyrhizobium sp. 31Argb]|uniref:STN domain-containing protein n=1 Tax=unclassified Bradyrhizobium TaxID=2631580 RepID=UPI00102E3BE9|nr:STN domain-containing protein [Bradyrhizobium sp. Leo170]TAI60288.1 energy transducer TonB [Bradyrhizobium sp. Leo170]